MKTRLSYRRRKAAQFRSFGSLAYLRWSGQKAVKRPASIRRPKGGEA